GSCFCACQKLPPSSIRAILGSTAHRGRVGRLGKGESEDAANEERTASDSRADGGAGEGDLVVRVVAELRACILAQDWRAGAASVGAPRALGRPQTELLSPVGAVGGGNAQHGSCHAAAYP